MMRNIFSLRRPRRSAWLASFALLLLAGCATSPVTNQRLERFDLNAGYRAQNLALGEHNSDTLLVILTFSGGGARAASLAYGVLEQLRDTRIQWEGEDRSLLDEVDVISSVSGGSVTAAYYALFGDRVFEDFPEKVLYKNIQGSVIRRILLPPDNVRMLSPFYTRTDVLAWRFDKKIFEGKTYEDLIQRGSRPYLVINGTDMSLGQLFEFTQDQFDHLYSDIGAYHVGHAVAASAAFPGVFSPVVLRNYKRGEDYCMPDWALKALVSGETGTMTFCQANTMKSYGGPRRRYIHVADGGIADNLGLMPVISYFRRTAKGYGFFPSEFYDKAKTVLILTVNAGVTRPRAWDMVQSPVSLLGTLLSSSTVPVNNLSSAQIEYLKLLIENMALEARLAEKTGEGESVKTPKMHFVQVGFSNVRDPEEREALNRMPTVFKLSRDNVDRLRSTAGKIVQESPEFEAFLSSLKDGNP